MPDPNGIYSKEGIATVLGARNFVPIDYAERHRVLGAHLGFDVTQTLNAISHIPLCMHGAPHALSRKRLATLIAQSTDAALGFVRDEVPEMLERLLAKGPHDVMGEFVNPCVNRLISTNVGTSIDLGHDTLVSRLFSPGAGVSKRRRMNAELADLSTRISRELPQLTTTEVWDRVALCILGTDALRGTLGCSLKDAFEGAESTAEYPRTGVPYIDREVLTSCPVDGTTYPEKSTLRAWLAELEESDTVTDRKRFFGYGAHVCLGRRIAMNLWEQVQKSLHEIDATISITKYTLRRDDVFRIPETFEIEVTNA